VPSRISYAQNGEDVRLWHAFGPREERVDSFVYVDVGANEPWHYSVTAALDELGWRGLLIEADPDIADRLARQRPGNVVVNAAAADRAGFAHFYQVPGTGLGTMDHSEAQVARQRGFAVHEIDVPAERLDDILDRHQDFLGAEIHAMTIDVEGAESMVLQGLTKHRPWVICIESVEPGTSIPTHEQWAPALVQRGYIDVAFDGINRWYVASEHVDREVPSGAGAPQGTTIAQAIAIGFHALDIGQHGWQTEQVSRLREIDNRAYKRIAWQRELVSHDLDAKVPKGEYERQIEELRSALVQVQGSRTFAVSRAMSRIAKAAIRPAHKALPRLKASRMVIERRHLRHVRVNMGHLTNSAFLAAPDAPELDTTPFEQAPPGLDLLAFTDSDRAQALDWLATYPLDDDQQLFDRLDNRNDVVGRLRAALRTRIRIATRRQALDYRSAGDRSTDRSNDRSTEPSGHRIAFDARCLQSPAFGTRGIGRFAAAALTATREAVGDECIDLIVDRGLLELPGELTGACRQITGIHPGRVDTYAAFINPSPMTHSPDPLLPLLLSDVYCAAVVYDFIPLQFPSIYLAGVAERSEYAACLDALRCYQDFACISHTVREELDGFLHGAPGDDHRSVVAWPRAITAALNGGKANSGRGSGILIASGDDPRKNTFGGLAGAAVATVAEQHREVVVLGMAGHDDRVHHWSIAAAMRPGEARTLGRISDTELAEEFAAASVAVVPSFAEGLSLPVIEALSQGTPVVASDIPAHRELIGAGPFLADPTEPALIARAIRRTAGRSSIAERQAAHLARHDHEDLERVIADWLSIHAPQLPDQAANSKQPNRRHPAGRASGPLRVALATPWAPQRSGVADYSVATGRALGEMCELTVFTTSDAHVDLAGADRMIHAHRSVDELLADPASADFDAVIAVVGNSHFHLPFIELTQKVDCIVIAHDTRMVEFYLSLRGVGGVQELMQRTKDPNAPTGISPALDDQIADMRMLQNAGLWEITRRARAFITHSPTTAERIAQQTGVTPIVLPFVNYRPPASGTIDAAQRVAARERLGLPAGSETFQLATFGFVDIRTKQVDTVVEAAGWLTAWGHSVALTIVGSAPEEVERQLTERAAALGLPEFTVTGFQSEDRYRDWLLAVDLGIQLRVSPFLGVSGPLADMAAVGTPAVASAGLCTDVDAPAFIERLPDALSPVTVAEAIERHIIELRSDQQTSWQERDAARREYLTSHSPEIYAQQLIQEVERVVRSHQVSR